MFVRNSKYLSLVMIILLLGFITACKVGPNYQRQAVISDSTYRFSNSSDTNSIADLEWISLFSDTVLHRLIKTGLEKNQDLLIAFARIEEARANFKIERGKQWPTIGLSGTAGYMKTQSTAIAEYSTYRATGEISWEIDLWGKLRRSKEAARANLFAQEAYQQGVRIMLINEIVQSYFNLLEYDNEKRITLENITIRQKSLDLVRAKLIAGTASGLVVAQAEAELALAKTEIPRLDMLIGMEENYISTLLGEQPHAISRGKLMLDQINTPAITTPGVPAELIVRRPDIIMAEQNLVAANANIGVARAMMFPTLSISGNIGAAFVPTNLIYSAVGSLVAPIFAGGQLRANVKRTQAVKEQLLLNYQKTINTSIKEVSDALLQVKQQHEIVKSQQITANAAQTAYELSDQLYNAGYASYLDVINAQAMLFSSQINLSIAQSNEMIALINLYTALGGGWK